MIRYYWKTPLFTINSVFFLDHNNFPQKVSVLLVISLTWVYTVSSDNYLNTLSQTLLTQITAYVKLNLMAILFILLYTPYISALFISKYCYFKPKLQGPVVQSIISLKSLLVVKILTILVSTISNSGVVLLKNCEYVAFANAKATHIFSAKVLAYMPYLMVKVLTMQHH